MSPWILEKIDDGVDDDLHAKLTERNALLAEQWGRYSRIEHCRVDSHEGIGPFWAQREPAISQAVMPYVYFPVSSAVIERSFSLAGLIDLQGGS